MPYDSRNGKAERFAGRQPLGSKPVMHALTLTAKLSALFGGSLFALFVGTLAIEDQRLFVSCRLAGASVDACLLQISGR